MLGTRLDHSLEPRLAQQKQDLTQELTAMLDERLAARLAERDQTGSQAEEIGRERIQRATTELLDERLPDMIKQQIGAESAMIMHLVERQVREIEEAGNTDPALLKRLIAEIDPIIDARATEIAKQEVQTAADEAVHGLAAANEAMACREKPPTTGGNLAAIGAATVGVIAAAIVYFMLS